MKNINTNKKSLIGDILNSISPMEKEKVRKKMLIAVKIDEAMKTKGWRIKDLLKALGKNNPSEVTKWLSGTHNFTIETLVELEQVLGIDLIDTKEKEQAVIS